MFFIIILEVLVLIERETKFLMESEFSDKKY